MTAKEKNSENRRKTVTLISLSVFILILIFLTRLFIRVFLPHMHSSEELHSFLLTFGWKGRFILFGLQCLQIVVAFIPGEIVELVAGYAYGIVEGTLICLAGVALSSSAIFLLTKKIGSPIVESFFTRKKIEKLHFLNTERKLRFTVFLLFFIPGTPKDILTYITGLTKMKLSEFLAITLVARIPSVISSTICGHMMGKENYMTALIVYAVTGAISLLGYGFYSILIKKRNNRN